MRVRADGVTVEGFDIDGRGGGDLGRDSSGVHVAAHGTVVRDVPIVHDTLFGVYLREADGAVVERCRMRGIPGKDPGEKGSGIHVWNTLRVPPRPATRSSTCATGSTCSRPRSGVIRGNVARDLRYGLHYMFSDDNLFEDNTFENGAAGTAIMYSKRIVFRRNRFLRNRGFASVGLLFKTCDDVLAEDNLIADNARGVFIEGSHRNVVRRNVIAGSDVAVVLYDSDGGNRFEGNSFVANMTPLDLVGAAHRHGVHRQLLVGQRRARPRRRRAQRPPVPAVERVRPLPRQPDRGRPAVGQPRPRRRSARRSARSRCCDSYPSRTRRRWRGPPALPGVPSPRAALRPERTRAGSPVSVALAAARRGGALGEAGGADDLLPRRSASASAASAPSPRSRSTWRAARSVALLGPNGSGKTTTLKAAAGLVRPTSGEVLLGDPARPAADPQARHVLSFLPQKVSFPDALSGREVVEFYRALRGAAGRAQRRGAALRLAERRRRARRRRPTPAAWCSAWGSRSRCCPTRRCCCWTSRPPRSTPTACARSTGSSSTPARTAAPCSSPRTSSATSSGSPTASPCWSSGRLVASLSASELKDRLAERGHMRLRVAGGGDALLAAVRALAAARDLVRRGAGRPGPGVPAPARDRGGAPAGLEIRGLTAEEGRLDVLYRELIAEVDAHGERLERQR